MIHRPATLNVKKLERTSACEPKLSIGCIYDLRRRSGKGKHIGAGEKDEILHKPQTAKSPH